MTYQNNKVIRQITKIIYTNLYIRLLLLIFYLLQSTVHVWPVLLSLCECSARTLYISYRSLQPSSKTPRYIFVPFLCQSFLFVSTFILFVLYNVFFSPSFYCPNYKRKRLLQEEEKDLYLFCHLFHKSSSCEEKQRLVVGIQFSKKF